MSRKTIEDYKYTGDTKFDIKGFKTDDTGELLDRSEAVDEFVHNLLKINKLQQKLYAERKEGVIFVFQSYTYRVQYTFSARSKGILFQGAVRRGSKS